MPRSDDYDDYQDGQDQVEVPFPPGAKAAGIIWICFGVLGLINTLLTFAMNAAERAANPGQPGGSNVCGGGCGVLFAVAFLVVGYQTVKGTAKGTLANGIGSLFFGLLYSGVAVLLIVLSNQLAGAAQPLTFIVSGVCAILALALLTAGILAIASRTAYANWLEAHGRGPRRRRPRTAEEEDYDDERQRPGRRRLDDVDE